MSNHLPTGGNVNDPGWGELIEDAIGVNLRGMKTLWVSIVAPARLFSATRTIDWAGRSYSPTLRVWLFLVAIVMFLQFIWAKPESYLGQQIEAALVSGSFENSILVEPETIEFALQQYVFIYPIVLLLFCMATALCIRIWGKGTSSVARIRLFFAAVLPGMFLTILITPLIAFVSNDIMVQYLAIGFALIFCADFSTAWRGLVPTYQVGARTWRALLLATISQFVYTTASTIAALMMLWLVQRSF